MSAIDVESPTAEWARRLFRIVRDALLESCIRAAALEWIEATRNGAAVSERRALAERHRALIARRSPEQIERIERAKGLR
jgi:hypothetical protein